MIETIEASMDTLMRQAPKTVAEYLDSAVEAIDAKFGDGYATKNPALVSAFLQAASMDYAGSIIAQQLREGIEHAGSAVADALGSVAENVRSDHPLMGGTVGELSAAVRAAGDAITDGLARAKGGM